MGTEQREGEAPAEPFVELVRRSIYQGVSGMQDAKMKSRHPVRVLRMDCSSNAASLSGLREVSPPSERGGQGGSEHQNAFFCHQHRG